MPSACYLPLEKTRRFTPLVVDYVTGKPSLRGFYDFPPDAEGLAAAIRQREQFPVDRKALQEVLRDQYKHLPLEAAVEDAIDALGHEATLTVCTAHQPNLATGYLYFIYKILHAIKLASLLQETHPDKCFVPVYYMGSEDADLEELGTFFFEGTQFVWDGAGQKGAVGRMKTSSLSPLLHELFKYFGPPGGNAEELEQLLREAYLHHDTIGKATQYLVHVLFGRYGLVVLDPDDARLKKAMIPLFEDELIHSHSEAVVKKNIAALEENGYKAQAHPRSINLFYLKDDIRERVERTGDTWTAVNTNIAWSKTELLQELYEHPDRFSPNVILRPLLQETILPNVAFIGGGAETAYWLQLKPLFVHYKTFFPALVLRQSAMLVNSIQRQRMLQTGLGYELLFADQQAVALSVVSAKYGDSWTAAPERDSIEVALSGLREKAAGLDPTLRQSADATLTKVNRHLAQLEKKMLRALKRREQDVLQRMAKLQDQLLPGGGLAERKENFMSWYLIYGRQFFDDLLAHFEPLRNEFLILEYEQ